MPPSPPHIPQSNERAVLQKLGLGKALPLEQLYPAGKQLIASMVAKGWIKKQFDGRTYCRTPEGEGALKTLNPPKR